MINSITNVNNFQTNNQVMSNTPYNKDMFLNLMVTQMKYQNPLEPTDEKETISQYAAFAQLEEMQNMTKEIQTTNALNLLGKKVSVEKNENGLIKNIEGTVESVNLKNKQATLYINGEYFDFEQVKQIIDERV